MDLLRYEFTTAPEGSYNYNLSQLIKKVRHYRSNTSIDDFRAALPELKKMEKWLQNVDNTMDNEFRNYLADIMTELEEEDAVTSQLVEELERYSKAVVSALFTFDFSLSDIKYEINNNEGIFWLEFHGYSDKKATEDVLSAVKEAFRLVCYKSGIVFIDKS